MEKGVILSEYFLGLGPEAQRDDALSSTPLLYTDGQKPLSEKLRKVSIPHSNPFHCQDQMDQAFARIHHLAGERRMKQLGARRTAVDPTPVAKGVKRTLGGGTTCDLTKRPRQVDVIAVCDVAGDLGGLPLSQAQLPMTMNITEVKPCEYNLVITGWGICDAMNIDVPGFRRKHDDKGADKQKSDVELHEAKRRAERQRAEADQRRKPTQPSASEGTRIKPSSYTRGERRDPDVRKEAPKSHVEKETKQPDPDDAISQVIPPPSKSEEKLGAEDAEEQQAQVKKLSDVDDDTDTMVFTL